MTRERKDTFYDYLLFFWQRKAIFILIPVVITALTAAISFLVGSSGYQGQEYILYGAVKEKRYNVT